MLRTPAVKPYFCELRPYSGADRENTREVGICLWHPNSRQWAQAFFKLDKYLLTGIREVVSVQFHTHGQREWQVRSLASWASSVNPNLRGNAKDALFWCGERGWCKLAVLLTVITFFARTAAILKHNNTVAQSRLRSGLEKIARQYSALSHRQS